MSTTQEIFGRDGALIGMIHAAALPGTPRHAMGVEQIAQRAADEARLLADAGFDAIIVENMHDVPYLQRTVGPEIVAAMTAVGGAVRAAVDLPLGVQILAGANQAALAVAHAIGAGFIRAEGFVFASVADEGLLATADAGPLLRYRRTIGAESIKILVDIKKKHSSHAMTADVDVPATARAAEFFGADGVIVTGDATGRPTSLAEVREVRAAVSNTTPVLVGSGVNPETVAAALAVADAVIVGSWFKTGGVWSAPPDKGRAERIVQARFTPAPPSAS